MFGSKTRGSDGARSEPEKTRSTASAKTWDNVRAGSTGPAYTANERQRRQRAARLANRRNHELN